MYKTLQNLHLISNHSHWYLTNVVPGVILAEGIDKHMNIPVYVVPLITPINPSEQQKMSVLSTSSPRSTGYPSK
jgi:hypothetical protein